MALTVHRKRIVFLALSLIACVSATARAQEKDWQREWNRILAGARTEGKVVVLGPPDIPLRRELPGALKAKFGVTVEYIGARGSDNEARLSMERQAGIYAADVVMAGLTNMIDYYDKKTLDPLLPALVLPEVLDASKWKKGNLWFLDPEQKYVLRLYSYITGGIPSINTRFVKPQEIKTTEDLLNPKWKGKISVYDPTVSGTGQNEAATYYRKFGKDFLKRLYVDQSPAFSRDKRQLLDWLALGAYPINLGGVEADNLMRLRQEGMPLELVPLPDFPGTLSAGAGLVALINKRPHPHAAQLFVNWVASKEGLGLLGRLRQKPTTRNDLDESYTLEWETPRAGVKYFDTYDWEFSTSVLPQVRVLIKELLGR